GEAKESEQGIDKDAGADDPALLSGESAGGIIADEAGGALEFTHDVIAGVDAGGAADALHLQAVADIDAGGADLHAAGAGHAVAGVGIGCLAAGFAAFRVVADDYGFLVGEGGLDASIGAED